MSMQQAPDNGEKNDLGTSEINTDAGSEPSKDAAEFSEKPAAQSQESETSVDQSTDPFSDLHVDLASDDEVEEEASEKTLSQPKLSRRQQREIDNQNRIRDLEAKLRELTEQISPKEKTATKNADPDAPRIEDYENRPVSEFLEATRAYDARRIKELARQEAADLLKQSQIAAQRAAQIEVVKKHFPDWDAVLQRAESEDMPVNPAVAAYLMESESGPVVAYYLAKNPSKIQELNGLSPNKAIAAVAKLEEKLQERLAPPKPKKTSEAPAKLADVRGAAPSSTMSRAEAARTGGYAAWKAAKEAEQANRAVPGSRLRK